MDAPLRRSSSIVIPIVLSYFIGTEIYVSYADAFWNGSQGGFFMGKWELGFYK